MRLPNLSLADRTHVYRILLLLAGFLIPLIACLNKVFHPSLYEPLWVDLSFSFICFATFILSFYSSFIKRNFTVIAYILSLILVIIFDVVLFKNNLHPVYVFETYVVFIGVSLVVKNLSHLKFYFLFFFLSLFLITIQIEEPLFPVYQFLFQLFVLSLLILILVNSYLRIQRTLVISNENFQTLINNADELYFLVDHNFSLLKINEKGKDFVLLKYELAVKEGVKITDLFSKTELNFLIKYCKKSFEGELIVLERVISFPGNIKKWFEIKFIPVSSVNSPSKVLISALDISENKRTLDVLRESEAKFRAISESSPLGVFSINDRGEVTYRNQNFLNISGLSESDWLENGIFTGVHPGDLGIVKEEWDNSFQSLKKFKGTYRYLRNDGSLIWTNGLAAPILDGNKLLGYVGTLEDITELKQASDLIKKNEEQFRDLFELAPIGMAMASLEGQILRINQAFLQTLGYSESEVLNTEFFDFIYPEDKMVREEFSVDYLFANGNRFQVEKRFLHKSNTIVFVILTVTLLKDHEGKPSFILLQILDISLRKQSEEELEQKNQELQKINNELDAFVYSSAHDLRAPLTSILGVVNLVRLENSNPGLDLYLDLVEQSVKKLDGFIRDIIEYSRNTRTPVKVERIEPREFIHECLNDLRYSDEAQNIDRIVEVDDHAPLYTDRRRLEVILNNLISNAIRYHDVNKSKKFIRINLYVDNEMVRLFVEDNGLGIEGKHLEKIFNMFFRASESSKGSGLGLYIVKEAVNKLGGSIKVESKVSEGTKFILEFSNKIGEGYEKN
ncbi:MAG TPA: PAS domain-containing sensor histidine kinase [Cytophagales bacterium]|nr:PAS domain-containing sensor histidine kinase [Cytophagales bacterium]